MSLIKLGGGGLYTQFPLFSLDLFFVVFHRLTIKGLYLNILSLQSSIHFLEDMNNRFFSSNVYSIGFIRDMIRKISSRDSLRNVNV